MKKKLILSSLIINIFIILNTYAGSGACSGHDGVNCSVGWDFDGSVICNDGWTESSVLYEDVKDVCLEEYIEMGPFLDVPVDHKNREAILYLYDNGIIGGYDDGTFQPDKLINRAELLKVLVEGLGITPDKSKYQNCFTDVKDDWYAPYVCYAKEIGWVDGYPDKTFKPAQTVIKAESIKMLLNSQGLYVPDSIEEDPFIDVPKEEWYAPYVSVAKGSGVLEETGRIFSPSEDMKRASVSENLYRLLTLEAKPDSTEDAVEEIIIENEIDELDEIMSEDQIIEEFCSEQWEDDADMQEYCKDQQYQGLEDLSDDKPDYVSDEEYVIIQEKCENDWSDDFSMQAYCQEEQFQGVQDLQEPKPDYVTEEEYQIIIEKCGNDWSEDYAMQAYCREQQYQAVETLNATTSDKRAQCAEDWEDDFAMRVYCEGQ